ncbi:hypothetical protein [Psychroserpens luteus]|uniref:Vitellogenin II n=1 Tax=Psychroserpens luteus TaxID=1434066 RepID=A0ABW5ZR54_9FLAO|nr:hypothetical protein [Psychroserpens luteus]
MQLNNYIQTKFPFFVALSLTFLLASCGSYQYVGYDNDGIYSDNEDVVYEEARTVSVQDQSVYKDYFTEKSLQYSEIPDDGSAIFTDIDSYEGNYDDEYVEDTQAGYAGWGQESTDVSINIYNSGWNSPYWGDGYGYGRYRPWGYNSFGWNNPYGYNYGWNSWGWNMGFGYGWNSGYGYGYGYGWNNNFWCPPYYRNNYSRGSSYAYNSGRRGANTSNLNRNSNYSRRSSSSSLSRRTSSTIRNNSSIRPRTSSPRTNNSSIRPRTSTPRTNNSSVRPRASTPRSSNSSVRPRRKSSSSSTPRASTRRSSGSSSSARSSSSSSSRSSGSSSSSSRGSSGRRGN